MALVRRSNENPCFGLPRSNGSRCKPDCVSSYFTAQMKIPFGLPFVRESGDNLFELPRSWSKLLSQGKEVAAAGLETEGGWIPQRVQ